MKPRRSPKADTKIWSENGPKREAPRTPSHLKLLEESGVVTPVVPRKTSKKWTRASIAIALLNCSKCRRSFRQISIHIRKSNPDFECACKWLTASARSIGPQAKLLHLL